MTSAAAITGDPRRLAALCSLWRNSGQDVWLTLQGTSMRPAILPGARFLLRCRPEAAAPGDIVAYLLDHRVIVHRLLAEAEDPASGGRLVVCQGDACPNPDPPVPAGAILGVVIVIRQPALWRTVLLGIQRRGRRIAHRRAAAADEDRAPGTK